MSRSSPIKDHPEHSLTFGTGVHLPDLPVVLSTKQPQELTTILVHHLTYNELVAIAQKFRSLGREYKQWLHSINLCAYAGAMMSVEAGKVMIPTLLGQSVTLTFVSEDQLIDSMSYVTGYIGSR